MSMNLIARSFLYFPVGRQKACSAKATYRFAEAAIASQHGPPSFISKSSVVLQLALGVLLLAILQLPAGAQTHPGSAAGAGCTALTNMRHQAACTQFGHERTHKAINDSHSHELAVTAAGKTQLFLPMLPKGSFCDRVTSIAVDECQALVALFRATNGQGWHNATGWLVSTNPCTWYGVIGCFAGHVTELSLIDNNLVGQLPVELGNLTGLFGLNLGFNELTGPIPVELGQLEKLQWLYLPENHLTGEIPAQLSRLDHLHNLSLWENALSGEIPPELGNMPSLDWLSLNGNELSGPIPPELGNLPALWMLGLGGNHLSGSIPPELADIASLGVLSLSHNQLTGAIPAEFGNYTRLDTLHLQGNMLTGEIPVELAALRNLYVLRLEDNQLSGPIPAQLGNLPRLQILDLSNNNLSGTIPASLSSVHGMLRLNLSNNQLSGPLQVDFSQLAYLNWLSLENNQQLASPLPESLAKTPLQTFYFQGTQLCVPGSPAFLSWLATIPDVQGTGLFC